ncbi:hypothetical protein [Vibrio gallaecicus]|nr:hypothetical protein [Vibrio gallaecicus]MDN3613578.1 hypothetical protein [Vibrio gallaecicus]
MLSFGLGRELTWQSFSLSVDTMKCFWVNSDNRRNNLQFSLYERYAA